MTKYLLPLGAILSPAIALAHGLEEIEEETPIQWAMEQINDLLPFIYFSNEHWVAAGLSILLWGSLLYTINDLLKKRR